MTILAKSRGDVRPGRLCLPPGPDDVVVYAIGDIHGCRSLLEEVHAAIDRDVAALTRDRRLGVSPAVLEVYLGDYIDRGDDVRGTIDLLLHRSKRVDTVFLRGNHEQYLLDFLDEEDNYPAWEAVGAVSTLQSYGVPLRSLLSPDRAVLRKSLESLLPPEHVSFLKDTKPYLALGSYVFVHAGVRPGVPLAEQKLTDLLHIREPFLGFGGEFGFTVVHGHTPVAAPELKHNRANIDTGAFATGRLTCLKIAAEVSVLEPVLEGPHAREVLTGENMHVRARASGADAQTRR